MAVSVVIPVYNGERYVDACIQSVKAQTSAHVTITAIDDASTDDSVQIIAAKHPDVRIIRNDANLGYAPTVNIGIHASQDAGVVLLLNQDTILSHDCLYQLLSCCTRSNIGIVGCKLTYPDGRVQHSGGFIEHPSALAHHYQDDEVVSSTSGTARRIDFVTGAVMLITRQVIDAIGMLDETLSPAYYEDIDYCFRARQAGFEIVYASRALAVHVEGSSITRRSYMQYWYHYAARIGFALKHFSAEELDSLLSAEAATVDLDQSVDEIYARMRAYALNSARVTYHLRRNPHDMPAGIKSTFDHRLLNLALHMAKRLELPKAALVELKQHAQVHEFQFRSGHPFIAKLRAAIHSLAGKWALRHALDQQNAYNHQLADIVSMQQRQIDELMARQFDLARQINRQNSAPQPVALPGSADTRPT